VGAGLNLEGALGLPLVGFEVGVRLGIRFGNDGKAANADTYGRLYDHETFDSGADTFTNPEIRVRHHFLALEIIELGWELRVMPPLASGTSFGLMPGIPLVVRIPRLLKVETGAYVPLVFSKDIDSGLSVPVAVWLQLGDFFLGPQSGVRFERGGPSVPFGFGVGYTLGGMLDLKAQLFSLRINDDFAKSLGGGLGVALTLP
jgi:hypothetical protein